MEIAKQFGIQPILLVAQIINFLILLFILKRFLYKPILKVLEERKQRIAKSLKDADKIEKNLLKTEEDREEKLAEATKEAKKIVDEATKSGSEVIALAHEKAAEDIQTLVKKAQESMKQEREQMHQEIRTELADMVALSLEKVTGKVLTAKDQKEIIEKSIKDLN